MKTALRRSTACWNHQREWLSLWTPQRAVGQAARTGGTQAALVQVSLNRTFPAPANQLRKPRPAVPSAQRFSYRASFSSSSWQRASQLSISFSCRALNSSILWVSSTLSHSHGSLGSLVSGWPRRFPGLSRGFPPPPFSPGFSVFAAPIPFAFSAYNHFASEPVSLPFQFFFLLTLFPKSVVLIPGIPPRRQAPDNRPGPLFLLIK